MYCYNMKFSKTLIPTLREVPNDCDADNISQILMSRAGLIKRQSNGLYIYMPLMNRIMEKVETEIRRAMARVDCSEVKFPILVHKEPLEQCGRWTAFGDNLFKIKDRLKKDMALTPTSEEAACFMAQSYIQSHNQLPFSIFQIQKKFRDEIRPKGGVMRTREFTMKDAYSFHATDKCLEEYFLKMQDAYHEIFANLGIKTVTVAADNGAMGGKHSREVMAISESGTDTVAICGKCKTAENIEVATPGETCKCGGKLQFSKAYELGHIFALGQHYAKLLNLTYINAQNKPELLTMGCYGIGVERTVAAIIEQNNDANGIAWPVHVAPITVNVIDIGQPLIAKQVYETLVGHGLDVLWDDRTNISPGVKFKDSDLIGIPYKIIVGKTAQSGTFEFATRTGEKKLLTLKEITSELQSKRI